MTIGILKERFVNEQRVALTPFGVESLIAAGAQVVVEHDAGAEARFTDEQYVNAGAVIAYSAEETAGRSDILLKVMPPDNNEYELIRQNQVFMSFQLLGMGKRNYIDYLLDKNVTAVGFELLKTADGRYPIMQFMSEISGQVAAQVASRFLRSDHGGRGVLLGSLAGIAPAAVVIIGAGVSGMAAAQAMFGLGAQIILLDNNLDRLRQADEFFNKRVTTVIASPENLRRGCKIADVLVGAISITDDSGHNIITENMVKTMKPGAVILDISINQGGCVETSRPTTVTDPIYFKHGVIHYAVPNMPSVVARTSTYALTNALLPYLQTMLNGFDPKIKCDPCVRCGVITYQGKAVHTMLHDMYGLDVEPFECC